jgi:UDP-3-O-[3-hydroxymyristoyl] glucosamine N-acyltransferase
MNRLSVAEIFAAFSRDGILTDMIGADVEVTQVAAVETCRPGDLVFVEAETHAKLAAHRGASAVVTFANLIGHFSVTRQPTILTSRNVKLARALICQKYFDRDLRPANRPWIHPAALIDETAVVAQDSVIGAGTIIGPRATVGNQCVLMANVVVEEDAVIGDRTVIHPSVVVGYGCRIGSHVIIHAGAIIGSEGFGFAQDEQRKHHRIPQMGSVVVEDRVVIGANCCIDRGAFQDTRIGSGTIMDNLCHIAHNVEIGADCILTAMTCIAGSTRLGQRVITSGQTGILDHIDIANDTVLLHRAGVTKDIKQPGMYGGAPIQPLRDYMKNQAIIRHLSELRGRIIDIEKRVAAMGTAPQS